MQSARITPLFPTVPIHTSPDAARRARHSSLEIDRWFGGQALLDRPGALVGEHLARAGLQSVEGGVNHALRRDLDDVQPASQIGLDETDVQP